MPNGNMSTDTQYPSATGLSLDGGQILKMFSFPRRLVGMTIEGTPGTGASYVLEALIKDDDVAAGVWQPVLTMSGNGAAATGHQCIEVVGEAVRINATNGTTPGTGNNVPKYTLNVFAPDDTLNDDPSTIA